MKTVVLDGAELPDRAALHRRLTEALDLPVWYGQNLDALRDCLSEVRQETEVVLTGAAALDAHLGEYAQRLRRVLTDSAAENAFVSWREEGRDCEN